MAPAVSSEIVVLVSELETPCDGRDSAAGAVQTTGRFMEKFGEGDTSFRAAGEIAGIERLVDDFYDIMDHSDFAATIRAMHPDDLTESRDKLARFLCGWLGGPKRYREKYGSIAIPAAHSHLAIDDPERLAWLECMRTAIARQPYTPEFAEYLLEQLHVPAERSMRASQARRPRESGGPSS